MSVDVIKLPGETSSLPPPLRPHLLDRGRPLVVVPLHVDDRVSHLQGPRVHDLLDSHVGGQGAVGVRLRRQVAPEVVLLGGLVLAVGGGGGEESSWCDPCDNKKSCRL